MKNPLTLAGLEPATAGELLFSQKGLYAPWS